MFSKIMQEDLQTALTASQAVNNQALQHQSSGPKQNGDKKNGNDGLIAQTNPNSLKDNQNDDSSSSSSGQSSSRGSSSGSESGDQSGSQSHQSNGQGQEWNQDNSEAINSKQTNEKAPFNNKPIPKPNNQFNPIDVDSDQNDKQQKPKRGNNALLESTQNFKPAFVIGQDGQGQDESFEHQTRDQYRNGGRGGQRGRGRSQDGGRGGRGGGRGGFNDFGGNREGGFSRDGDRGRGNRGRGRGGGRDFNNDRNGGRNDKFGDKGGNRFVDRGDRGRGRGNDRGRQNFSRGFDNYDNRSQHNFQGNYQQFNTQQPQNNFNQHQNNFNQQSPQMQTNNFQNRNFPQQQNFSQQSQQMNTPPNFIPYMNPMMMNSNPMQMPNGVQMTPQQLLQANQLFSQMYGMNPQMAFKKKTTADQAKQFLSSSRVSNLTKKTKKSKKSKKIKDSSSQSGSQSSQNEANQSLLNISTIISPTQNASFHSTQSDKEQRQLIKQKRTEKNRYKQSKPNSRKAWPSSFLIVIGNSFIITLRPITEHSDCILAIPYKDLSMNIYPGKITIRSEINYREKLRIKMQHKQLQAGSVYFQDNLLSNEYPYHFLAFCLVDENLETIVKIIKSLFLNVFERQKKFDYLNKILIPLSMFKGHEDKYQKIFEIIVSEMQKYKSVVQIILTTEDVNQWVKANESFSKLVVSYIDKNEIWN